MNLLTKELRAKLPALYTNENTPIGDQIVICKFFITWSNWTWYALEFDGKDLFFGLVEGHERELGYFSLSELQGLRNTVGLGVERDLHFEPTRLGDLFPQYNEEEAQAA